MSAQRISTARDGEPVAIAVALKRFMKESGLGAMLSHGEVHRAWNQALGPRLAQKLRPVLYRAGELIVEVESAGHKQQFESFKAEQFRCATNQILGSDRVHRVTIKLKK